MTKASSTNFWSELLHFSWKSFCGWERLKATISPCFTATFSSLNLCVTHSSCQWASSFSPRSFQPQKGGEEAPAAEGDPAVSTEHEAEAPAQGGPSAVTGPCWRCLSSSSSPWGCAQALEVPRSWLMPFQTETRFSSHKCQTPDWCLHVAVAGVWNNSD